MSVARFLTDEDVFAGRLTEDDSSQLEWAANQGRVLMTFNVGDFVRLHSEWLRSGRHHAGLVVSEQRPRGETLRRLLSLAKALDAEDMRDRLEFLTNWPP